MVTLRPLRADDFDAVWAHRGGPGSAPPVTGRGPSQDRVRAQLERSGRLRDGRLDLGIEADGRLVGMIEARRADGAMPPGVFEIGIGLFDGERGKGFGGPAVAAFVDRLVDEEGAGRVQASTDVGNAPMRRVLERLGFRLEGVMRGYMPEPDGTRADYALYAVTAAEWRDGRAA